MTVTYKPGDHDTRPWGTWEVLATGEKYIVKRIIVQPGQILSLQSHNHRSEHWIIADGVATVTLGDQILTKQPNEHVFIPVTTKHRVANKGLAPMTFIEVQTGDILDENDIIRYEDVYKRV